MLIGLPGFLGADTRAVAANVDGLGHLEIAAIGERQTNEHPLRDAFFGALTWRGGIHGDTNPQSKMGMLGRAANMAMIEG